MTNPSSSPSQRKLIGITLFVILFFGMCLFQAYGEQETWPFSYFGMYKKNISVDDVKRTDVEVINPDGKIIPFYNLGVNGYYLEDHFHGILTSQKDAKGNPIDLYTSAHLLVQESPGVIQQLNDALREDVFPVLKDKWKRRGVSPEATVRVRFRLWRQFTWENRKSPDVDQVFIEKPWKDL